MGQSQQDFFFWNGHTSVMQVLTVTGNGSSYNWKQLLPGWDNPHMAHAPTVSLERMSFQRPLNVPVSSMTTAEKVAQAMLRSMKPEYMPTEVANTVKGMITPEAIGQMLAIEAIYAVSLFFGVGEVATALLVVMGTYFVGEQVLEILKLLKAFISRVTDASTDAELEEAARLFAQVMVMGTQMVVTLLTRTRSRAHSDHTVLRMKGGRGGGNTGHTPGGGQAGASSSPGRGSGRSLPGEDIARAPTPAPKPKGVPRRQSKFSTKTRDQRAKTNTDNMDTQRGGHSKGKYGTQVTPKEHEDRLRTGRDPSTGQIPVGKKGKPRNPPAKSSGFDSDKKHLEALGKADDKLNKGIADGSVKPKLDGSYEVTVDVKDAGTSYSLNPPTDRTNGKIVTTKVQKATAIYRLDPVTGKPKLITLFPGLSSLWKLPSQSTNKRFGNWPNCLGKRTPMPSGKS